MTATSPTRPAGSTGASRTREVHTFVNDLERPIGTYLYGRRLYQVMVFWENVRAEPDQPPFLLDFANLWQAAEKIVYSTTLETTSSARSRIERTFDPAAVRALKDTADRDLSIGGPTLAAHAFRAGLVDEVRLFVSPPAVPPSRPRDHAGVQVRSATRTWLRRSDPR